MRSAAHRSLTAALLLVVAAPLHKGWADTPSTSAVVRLRSHGASATVIHTEPGRTFLLSCAHAFEGRDRFKALQIDGLAAPSGAARVLAVDADLDLSLIEVRSGPVAAVAPVAGPGYRPGPNLLSAGFDEMKTPATVRPAHIIRVDRDVTWTREPPWHGRSGGGLIDADSGQLLGVVSGYVSYPAGPGIYVSHEAIERFLKRQGWWSPSQSRPPPHPQQETEKRGQLPAFGRRETAPPCPT
jgi:hypothetical protein